MLQTANTQTRCSWHNPLSSRWLGQTVELQIHSDAQELLPTVLNLLPQQQRRGRGKAKEAPRKTALEKRSL